MSKVLLPRDPKPAPPSGARQLKRDPNGVVTHVEVREGDDLLYFNVGPLERYQIGIKQPDGLHSVYRVPPSQDEVNAYLVKKVDELAAELKRLRSATVP